MSTLVIDTNIFISALIKDGLARKIITKSRYTLLFPEIEFEELKNNRREIIKKSGLSEKELDTLLLRLLNYVRIIPTNIIIKYREQAKEIMGHIDFGDILFIATALAFNCPILSEDKHFEKQKVVKILKIKDILSLLDN